MRLRECMATDAIIVMFSMSCIDVVLCNVLPACILHCFMWSFCSLVDVGTLTVVHIDCGHIVHLGMVYRYQ